MNNWTKYMIYRNLNIQVPNVTAVEYHNYQYY